MNNYSEELHKILKCIDNGETIDEHQMNSDIVGLMYYALSNNYIEANPHNGIIILLTKKGKDYLEKCENYRRYT